MTTDAPARTTTGAVRDIEPTIGGVTCASCANRIEGTLNKLDGVTATVNLAQARPGSIVCLSGGGLTNAEVEVTASGTPQQPITIVADGATVRSMSVTADYVVIRGLIENTIKDTLASGYGNEGPHSSATEPGMVESELHTHVRDR